MAKRAKTLRNDLLILLISCQTAKRFAVKQRLQKSGRKKRERKEEELLPKNYSIYSEKYAEDNWKYFLEYVFNFFEIEIVGTAVGAHYNPTEGLKPRSACTPVHNPYASVTRTYVIAF